MQTKQCTKCGIEKPLSEFGKDSRIKTNKLRSICKSCNNICCKIYRQKHKTKLKEKQKIYYEEHKEERTAYQREYAKTHPKNNIYAHPLSQKWRDTYKYKLWRLKVYKRDNYTCQDCGKTHCKVYAHHIKEGYKYPKLRYDINNGTCLCIECHYKAHNS